MKPLGLLVAGLGAFVLGAWWAVHGEVDEVLRLSALGDDLADELEDTLKYVDDYFVLKHRMTEPLEAWRSRS